MNITETIKSLELIREKYGDAEMLFWNDVAHYSFTVQDWSSPECPNQLLMKGWAGDNSREIGRK